ncbi:MAG: ABC transporter permease subunit [Anaerolineae bacterium]|nr:ABC transporter permease subunit [Anaerolineae bacterium]
MTQPGIWIIARLTFKEAVRRKIVLCALLLGLVFLGVYGAGLYFTHHDMMRATRPPSAMIRNQMYNFLMLSGLYVVNFLLVVMAVLTSIDTVAGEIASGTIHALAAKPIRRWEILLGKWLGFAAMLTLYLLLMAGGVFLLVWKLTGYRPPNIERGLALLWLNGILMLNLSLLGGTRLSTLANGVLAFAAYGVAFVGGWIEQIGAFLNSPAAINVGIVSSLLIPSETLWKRAAYEMRSLVVDAIGFSPFTSSGSVPSTLMLGYAVFYTLLALGLAVWSFNRRDL